MLLQIAQHVLPRYNLGFPKFTVGLHSNYEYQIFWHKLIGYSNISCIWLLQTFIINDVSHSFPMQMF